MLVYIPPKTESFLQQLGALVEEYYKQFPNISLYFSTGLVVTELHSSLEAL